MSNLTNTTSHFSVTEKVQYALKTALNRTMQTAFGDSGASEKAAPPRIFPKDIMQTNLVEIGKGDIDEDGYFVSRSMGAGYSWNGTNTLVDLEAPELIIAKYRIINPSDNKITSITVETLAGDYAGKTQAQINALPTSGQTYPWKNWFFRGHYTGANDTAKFSNANSTYDGLQLAWDKATPNTVATDDDIVPHLKYYLQVQTDYTNISDGSSPDNITYIHYKMKGLIGLDQNFTTTISVNRGEGGGCSNMGSTGTSAGEYWFTQATSGTLAFYGVGNSGTDKVNTTHGLSSLSTTHFPMISYVRYVGETGFGASSGGGGGTATGGNADTISGSLKTVDFQDLSGSHGDGQILNWDSVGGTWMTDIYGGWSSANVYRPNYSNALYIYLADGTLVAQVNFKVVYQANNACMVENHSGWFMNYQASSNDFVIVANKNDFQNNIISHSKNCDPSVRWGNANGNNPDGHPVFPTSITDSWPATNPMYFACGGEDTWFIRTWKMGDDEYQQRQKLKNYIHNVAVIKDTGMPDFTDEGRLDTWKGKTISDIQTFLPTGSYIQAFKRDGTLISTMRVNTTSGSGNFCYLYLDKHNQELGNNVSEYQIYMMTHVNNFNFKCKPLAQTKNFGGIGWDAAGITNPDGGEPDDGGFIDYRWADPSSKHNLGVGERDWFVRKYQTQTVQKSLKFDGGIRTNGGIVIMDGGKPDFTNAWSTLYDNNTWGNNSNGDYQKMWLQTLVKGRRIYLWRKSTGEYLGSTVIDDFANNTTWGYVHFGRDWKWMCSSSTGWYERRLKLNIKYLEGGGTRNNHWLSGTSDSQSRLAGHDIVMDLIYIPDHRKNPTGRLGIGTTSPEDRLHVKGGAIIESDRGLNVKNAEGDSLLRVKKFPGKEVYGNFNTTGMWDYKNVLYFFDEDENFVCELEDTQTSHDHFFGPSPSTSGNSIYWSGGPQIIPTALIMMLDNKVPGNSISKRLVEIGYGETASWTSYSTLQGGSKWYMSINTVSKVQLGQQSGTLINEPHHAALEIVGDWNYNQAKYGRCWINFLNSKAGATSESRWQIGTYLENGYNAFAIRGGPSSHETTYEDLNTPFFIRYDGEIGIGTQNPSGKLHIQAPTNTHGLKITGNSGNNAQIYCTSSNYGIRVVTANSSGAYYSAYFEGSSNKGLYVRDDGYVGIGQTTPTCGLELDPDANMRSGMKFGRFMGAGYREHFPSEVYASLSTDNHGSFTIGNNVHIDINNIIKFNNTHVTMCGPAICMPGNAQPHQGSIIFYTADPQSVTAGNTFRQIGNEPSMTINHNGCVGIGEADPSTPLHIKFTQSGDPTNNIKDMILLETEYSTDFGGSYREGGSSICFFVENSGQGLPGQAARIVAGCYESSSSTEYHSYLAFHTSNNSSSTGTNERMVIDDNGYVGIGETTPAAMLHVAGYQYIRNSDSSYTLYGPNSSWGNYLYVGSGPHFDSGQACIFNTTKNLHIEPGNGGVLYLGHYNDDETRIGSTYYSSFYGDGARVCIQGTTDGGSGKGLFYWHVNDPAWGSYMVNDGQSLDGSGKSTSTPGNFTGWRVVMRCGDDSNGCFLWENHNEDQLASFRASDGWLQTQHAVWAHSGTCRFYGGVYVPNDTIYAGDAYGRGVIRCRAYNGVHREGNPGAGNWLLQRGEKGQLPGYSNSWYMVHKTDNTTMYFSCANVYSGYISNSGAYHMNNYWTEHFTGQHRPLPYDEEMLKNLDDYIGLIVSATNEICSLIRDEKDGVYKMTSGLNGIHVNEAIPKVILTTEHKDKKCYGIVSGGEDENNFNSDTRATTGKNEKHYGHGSFTSVMICEEEDNRLFVNSVGEGGIWVSDEFGPIESGDYITSSGVLNGYGVLQDDDILHNYTVAKATIDCDFTISYKGMKKKTRIKRGCFKERDADDPANMIGQKRETIDEEFINCKPTNEYKCYHMARAICHGEEGCNGEKLAEDQTADNLKPKAAFKCKCSHKSDYNEHSGWCLNEDGLICDISYCVTGMNDCGECMVDKICECDISGECQKLVDDVELPHITTGVPVYKKGHKCCDISVNKYIWFDNEAALDSSGELIYEECCACCGKYGWRCTCDDGYGCDKEDMTEYSCCVKDCCYEPDYDENASYKCREIIKDGKTYRIAFIACTYHCG